MKGISNGMAILVSVVTEALDRCQFDGNSFYSRVGGIQGLSQLLTMNEKEVKVQRGIGKKTYEVIKMIKRLILEAIAESAEEHLKAMGQWKEPSD